MREIPDSPKQETQHPQSDDLGRECLCRRNADFQTRPQAYSALAFAGNRTDDIIANSERRSPLALALTEGRYGIRRLPL